MPIKHSFTSAVTDSGVAGEVSSDEWNDAHDVDTYIELNEISTPSTPASTKARLYVKSDGRVYSIDDGGIEYGPFDVAGPVGFPRVVDSATSATTSNATSHTVTLPTWRPTGKLMLMIVGSDGNPTISATGWTSVTSGTSGGDAACAALYRIADGSEASTISVATTASEQIAAWVGSFTGHHASAAPEGAGTGSGTAATGANPPSLTPTWGSANTLWFAVGVHDASANASNVHSHLPIPYNYVWHRLAGSTVHMAIAIGSRAEAVASYDPGTIFAVTSEQWAAMTIAIRPL